MSVKILIADDHAIVRKGIRMVLQGQKEWEICGEAADGLEAVRLVQKLQPDIIILDVTMPVMGGLGAAHQISQSNPDCKVLIFTMHDSTTLAKFAQRSGAHGLVVKSRATEDLVEAMQQLLAGKTFFYAGDVEGAEIAS